MIELSSEMQENAFQHVCEDDRPSLTNLVLLVHSLYKDKVFTNPSVQVCSVGYIVTWTLPLRDFSINFFDMEMVYDHMPGRIDSMFLSRTNDNLFLKIRFLNSKQGVMTESQIVRIQKRRKKLSK